MRFLIVNADDFGLSEGVNAGVVRAHERGIVRSASLMVRAPAATTAAAYARHHPALSVGLHVALCEWAYRDEGWTLEYQVVPLDDRHAVADEVSHQLELFRNLVGQSPTHLDSHQHVHRAEPIRSIMLEVAHDLRIPLRLFHPAIHYCGAFYGQTSEGRPQWEAITPTALAEIIERLPPGWSELACHPGSSGDVSSIYRDEREREVESLCDPRVSLAIKEHSVILSSFHHFKANEHPGPAPTR